MTSALSAPQNTSLSLQAGRFRARAEMSVTAVGLLAIGALVGVSLLSIPPTVRAAGSARRLSS